MNDCWEEGRGRGEEGEEGMEVILRHREVGAGLRSWPCTVARFRGSLVMSTACRGEGDDKG